MIHVRPGKHLGSFIDNLCFQSYKSASFTLRGLQSHAWKFVFGGSLKTKGR
jgi:hypothetical protein